MARVLVTGGSGFIGSHALLQLLEAGHDVRTTVRSPSSEEKVRALLATGGVEPGGRLAFFTADLLEDAGWNEAVRGCDYVLHIASPFPAAQPTDENELIVPAREGALRVLRAAKDAGVRRVVLTSSFAAVGYGHPPRAEPYDETSWTDLEGRGVSAYVKSKTLAERAAWTFVDEEGGDLELSVVNPVGVFGPVLGPDYSTSILLVQRLLDGSVPGCPKLSFGVVDVRDVVDLHVRAMTDPAARGERFLAVSGRSMSILDMSRTLRDRLGDAAKRAPTRQLPNWLVRLVAIFDSELGAITPELGQHRQMSNDKARSRLGWDPRPPEDALVATAESLLRLDLL
ncbi:MAG: aldehyde reductase [Gemmatimonadales bacterium]|jgi:nucleoside-diphosphate-sugar epimerase